MKAFKNSQSLIQGKNKCDNLSFYICFPSLKIKINQMQDNNFTFANIIIK